MRASGILMHISSLPSPCGIGTFGKTAYEFVDFLKSAGQSYWQILPLGPTSYRDSPYQCFSSFAGNPYFVDLDLLCENGLLKLDEHTKINWGTDAASVDYDKLYRNRFKVLRLAFRRFGGTEKKEYTAFCKKEDGWLHNYALFMAIKSIHGDISWHGWDDPYKLREKDALARFEDKHSEDIEFWKFVQYEFLKQWLELRKYANTSGIKIIGDLPIYAADDSADVWANPELFALDKDRMPTVVAGCPPDAFTDLGQLWGNPVYNWYEMKKDGYGWWIQRMRKQAELCDLVRLDHFRGLESFYAIPYGEKTAERGKWEKGPGIELIDALRKNVPGLDVIAENLGVLTPAVRKLHQASGYPGMRVLHFAFSGDIDNEYLPHNIEPNNVAYAGTHDNATTRQWLSMATRAEKKFCLRYMNRRTSRDFVWRFIRLVLSTAAELAIIPMQDYLKLGGGARMNFPGTLSGNWQWRARRSAFTKRLGRRIKLTAEFYGRGHNEETTVNV